MPNWKLHLYNRGAKKEKAKINAAFAEIISSNDIPNLDRYVDMINAEDLSYQDERNNDMLKEKLRKKFYIGGLIVSGIGLAGICQYEPEQMVGLRIITIMGAAGLLLGGIGVYAAADYDANNVPDLEYFGDEFPD